MLGCRPNYFTGLRSNYEYMGVKNAEISTLGAEFFTSRAKTLIMVLLLYSIGMY